MSQEHVEIVRRICQDWERGDFSSAEWAHRDIEWVIADGPAPGRWTGKDGMAAGFRGLLSAWEEWRVETNEFRELDDERVLVLVRAKGRGRTSGLEVEQTGAKGANLFHIGDGKVTRFVLYLDRGNAFDDLGLSE
jgi:ketosteroid isomerase-like protein